MIMKRDIPVFDIQFTPLDKCLKLWLRWQSRNDSGLDWRGRSVVLESEAAASSEQLYDRMDSRTAEAMDAMIGDLKPQHNWAIKKRCGLATIWRFPQLVFADELEAAEAELVAKMKKNLATYNYFE